MLSKNTIKHFNSLKSRKFRIIHKQFIAEGPKLVEEFLNSDFHIAKILSTDESKISQLQQKYKETEFDLVKNKELERISTLKTANEIIALIDIPTAQPFPISALSGLILMLDEIKDPGNMGTIIRTADWFGIKQIICSMNSVDLYNPKVVQASMGSIARVKVHYSNLSSFLKDIPEKLPVYGTVLNGKSIYSTKLNDGIILIGNESRGISNELLPYITHPIIIPHYSSSGSSGAESLNASVATAITCAEFRRPKLD